MSSACGTIPGIERIGGRTGDGSSGYIRAFSSFEPHELEAYLEALSLAHPGVRVDIERMPTGMLAEEFVRRPPGEKPCMILGWADTAAAATLFSKFIVKPDGPTTTDPDGLIRPTGFSVAFTCDRAGLAALGLPSPTSWGELVDPRLRGRILFPDPRLSGAGFLALSTILQAFGDAGGWQLAEAIHRNVLRYPASSSEPAREVGEGRVLVGVTVRVAAEKRHTECPETDITAPKEAEGLESEVYGITKFARNRAVSSSVLGWFADPARAPMFKRFAKVVVKSRDERILYRIDASAAARGRRNTFKRFSTMISQTTAETAG